MLNKKLVYYPIKLLLTFLIFTEVFYFVGPIDYLGGNEYLLVLYLVILNVFLYCGYKNGVKTYRYTPIVKLSIPIVQVIIIIGLIGSFLNIVQMWGERGLSLSFKTFVEAFLNPGDAYHSQSNVETESTPLLTITSIFYWASIPLGLFFWKRLPIIFRILVISIIFIKFISWMGIGTRKGVMDLILIIFSILCITKYDYIGNPKNKFKIRIIFSVIIGLFLFYFIFSNLSRSSYSLGDIGYAFTFDTKKTYQNWPVWLLVSLSNIMSYLCQGYYALSLALEMGILPIAIGGSSWFTIMLASRFGEDPTTHTYMYALESMGIDMSMNWHTAYVWLANDFTFIGVPIFLFLVGRYFAIVWQDCINRRNDFAFIVMPMFVLMVFYLFANNQVFSSMFITFVIWFIIYLLSRFIKNV